MRTEGGRTGGGAGGMRVSEGGGALSPRVSIYALQVEYRSMTPPSPLPPPCRPPSGAAA